MILIIPERIKSIQWRSSDGWIVPDKTREGNKQGNCWLWSCINAIKGEITKVIPSCNKVGSWYVNDLPLPVGAIYNY